MNDIEILEQDIAEIYLGNLATVDTDLQLPAEGKRGSRFTWRSGEILFISHDGKVTRPTAGVGNREVVMTVTATYQEASIAKDYVATVLEEALKTTIIRTVDIEEMVEADYCLPGVCVVELDNQRFSTAAVEWQSTFDPKQPVQVITGKAEGTELPVYARLTVQPQDEQNAVVKEVVSKAAALTEACLYKDASDRMLTYLRQIDLDQLLYSFRSAAGLPVADSQPMTGWDAPECNLRGHTTGHYLSALSLAHYATKEAGFKQQLDYLVKELGKCQQAMSDNGMGKGFLSAYNEDQFDLLEQYTTYPTIWAPYYALDKILNGLLDSYEFGASEQGLEIAVGIGEWVSRRLGRLTRQQLSKMWSIYIAGEFGAMITAMMRLYHFTRQEVYKKTALFFENDKLFVPMGMNYDTLDGVHANQHIPQIIGALDLYEETGKKKYLEIAENFWQMVVTHHSYSIGGVGETEMFKQADLIAAYITHKTAESCASHNMLKLTKKLYDLSPQASYFEYYENALHNHLLSAASHTCDGGTTYFMPLAPGGQKQFDTAENTCCHGSGLETLLRFQKDIYSFGDDTCYVNLFYPSRAEWAEKAVAIDQNVSADEVTVGVTGTAALSLKIRIPGWMHVREVMKPEQVEMAEQEGYLVLSGNWYNEQVTVAFDKLRRIHPAPDNGDLFSISDGPDIMVYCGAESEFMEISPESLEEMLSSDKPLVLKGQELRPLNTIGDERYHAYFKLKKA